MIRGYDNWKTTPPDYWETDPPEELCDVCGDYDFITNMIKQKDGTYICNDCMETLEDEIV